MTKEYYIIPCAIITFIINVNILYDVVPVNEKYEITYFFPIFISLSVSILSYRFFSLVDSFKLILVFSLVLGGGVFIYTSPFLYESVYSKIWMSVEVFFLISYSILKSDISNYKDEKIHSLMIEKKELINTINESCKTEQNKNCIMQETANIKIATKQSTIEQDIINGIRTKDIAEKHCVPDYKVSRIKKKLNESKREIN